MERKGDVKLINIHLKDSWFVSVNVEIETPEIREESMLYYFIERGEKKALYKVFYDPRQGYNFEGRGYDLGGLAHEIENRFESGCFCQPKIKSVEVHRYMYPKERASAERANPDLFKKEPLYIPPFQVDIRKAVFDHRSEQIFTLYHDSPLGRVFVDLVVAEPPKRAKGDCLVFARPHWNEPYVFLNDHFIKFNSMPDLTSYIKDYFYKHYPKSLHVRIMDHIVPSQADIWESNDPRSVGIKLHSVAERSLNYFQSIGKDSLAKEYMVWLNPEYILRFYSSNGTLKPEEEKMVKTYLQEVISELSRMKNNVLLVEEHVPVSKIDSRYRDGYIDAVVMNDSKATVFDFKTGFKGTYNKQLELYCEALKIKYPNLRYVDYKIVRPNVKTN